MPILKDLTVGPYRFSPNLILAPMSGVTNSAFRRLILRYNPNCVGLVVTEFISIEGLTRLNEKSRKMLQFRAEEQPLSIQLFGYDISRMVEAAKMVEDVGARIVDINSGCPVPKVVKKGGGCELMRQPTHLGKMLEAVARAVSIPVTLKIRAGWDCNNRNALEVARIAAASGIAMLTVHGRTRTEMYRGSADWELVDQIARLLSIPVIGSGDIVDYRSIASRARPEAIDGDSVAGNSVTGDSISGDSAISGFMIGRAALANPWIFSEIAAHDQGRAYTRPSDLDTATAIEDYLRILEEDEPEKVIIGRLKQFCSQVTRRVRGSASARKSLLTAPTIAEFRQRLAAWREILASDTDGERSRFYPRHDSGREVECSA